MIKQQKTAIRKWLKQFNGQPRAIAHQLVPQAILEVSMMDEWEQEEGAVMQHLADNFLPSIASDENIQEQLFEWAQDCIDWGFSN